MDGGTVAVRGLHFGYSVWGPPDAAPVSMVLIHGLSSSRHIWDLVAPTLGAEHRVIALDQRGHGDTDEPDDGYEFDSMVADLDAVLEALDVREPVVLVGHSWGASVVLHYAVAHPHRTAGLVLLDGGTSSPGERWSWDETLTRLTPPDIDGLRWDELYARMSSRNAAYHDPRAEAIGRSLFHIDAEGRIHRRLSIPHHLKIVHALWEQRPDELLPLLDCPLLILPARQSTDAADWRAAKEATVNRALSLQPRGHVRWFEDTVHDIPLQRPDELAAELLAFADLVDAQQRAFR